jgi:hypothetical protein
MDKATSPPNPPPARGGIPASNNHAYELVKTQTLMQNSGMSRDNAFCLASKALGKGIGSLNWLTIAELVEIRRFFHEELEG